VDCLKRDLRIHRLALFSLALVLARLANAQQAFVDPATSASVAQVTSSILNHGKAYEYDQHLADEIGPRLTGSAAYARAVQWSVEQFRVLGLSNVHTEKFPMRAAWEPETQATAKLVEPHEQTLHLISLGWSPSTPAEGIRARVVLIRDLLSPEALNEDRGKISGNIALVDRSSYSFPNGLMPGQYFAALNSLKQYGARAVLVGGGRSANDVEYAGAATTDGTITDLPIARMGREDLQLLVRLVSKGPVTMEFSYRNRIRMPAEAENVVAEIPGADKTGEFVVVGAHLDSVQAGTGAQDNGAGVASVLDTARALKELGIRPRRTIRFVLFGGEEEWELGSTIYVAQHVAELDRCVAMLVTDTGSDTAHGWYINGREDEVPALQEFGLLLKPLGGDGISREADYLLHSDHTAFYLRGVPTLMLWTEMTKYFQFVHQPGDTFDKVDKEKLAKGTAIVAVTALMIADSQTAFAKRQSEAEVEETLKALGEYDGYLDKKKYGKLE
jgi:hypothetical protein